ncbi:MAG: (deoxy)nucleoside triphosphate pyrophosphohydrolase [Oscillospiraceae bacterium]|nr:(deoxy)nucleoside triphosphate pyrophosphohydrolase [Oscillospiraceae bacterium]
MKKTVSVVAAVIHDSSRVFATQRGYGDYKDRWEFPGGKVEQGETPEQALRREILEELDTVVKVEDFIARIEYDCPDFRLSMDCYMASVESGSLTLLEHESSRWIALDELDSVNWLPADWLLLPYLTKEKE